MVRELVHTAPGESDPLQAPVAQAAGGHQHPVEVGDSARKVPDGGVHEAPAQGYGGGCRKGRLPQPLAHLQGSGVVVQRVLVGVGGGRLVAGLHQVVQGLLPLLALVVVVGQRLVVLRQPVGVELLDGRRHDAVQGSAPLHEQGGVGHVMGQGVLEHVGQLGEVGLLVNQLQRFELGQQLVHLRLDVRDAIQQPHRELAADDGGELDGFLGLALQPVDAAEDHLLDGVGHPDLLQGAFHRVATVGLAEDAGLHQGLGDLLDVEGVALRLAR